MAEIFDFTAGTRPLLVSMPHVGLEIPDAVARAMTPAAALRADTDWHVDRLYDFLSDMGVSVLKARFSRYLIDLNRAPDGRSLYPGASNTELCPTSTFAEEPLYRPGAEPDAAEVARRREAYWRPYHKKLTEELARLRTEHARVVLWDAHSIKSVVPRFFEGKLIDLNFGTAGGDAAEPGLVAEVLDAVVEATDYTHVLNGRFKGGYITRSQGKPEEGVSAIQLELSQATYMDEDAPFTFREDLAAGIRPVLKAAVTAALDWAERQQGVR